VLVSSTCRKSTRVSARRISESVSKIAPFSSLLTHVSPLETTGIQGMQVFHLSLLQITLY